MHCLRYFTSGSLNYNFTDSLSKAYGNNLTLKGTKCCIYSSDVNQDGVVDLLDLINVDNHAYNFVTGYVPTDINGDGLVDLLDLIIGDNNAYNFVSVKKPSVIVTKPAAISIEEKKVENK